MICMLDLQIDLDLEPGAWLLNINYSTNSWSNLATKDSFGFFRRSWFKNCPWLPDSIKNWRKILTVKEKGSIFNPFGCMMVLFHLRGMSMSDQHDMTSFYHVTSSLATDGVPLNTDVGSHSLLEPDSLPGTGELTTCKWKNLYFFHLNTRIISISYQILSVSIFSNA